MNTPAAPVKTSSRWRERLSWLAPLGLAVFAVCSGCFLLFSFALTARDELEGSVLGSDWRVWRLHETNTNGIGVSQTSSGTSASGQPCRTTTVWLITWQPVTQVERIAGVCD